MSRIKQQAMSSYGAIENDGAHRLNQDFVVDGFEGEDVVVRMAVPNRPLWHFVDDGEEVELYVTFARDVVGIPDPNRVDDGEIVYKVDLAGEPTHLKPLLCYKDKQSTMFKASTKVTSSREHALTAGQPVPFSLQYRKGGRTLEISTLTEPNMPVYYQPVWKKLLARDDSMIKRIYALDGNDLSNEGVDQTDSSDSNESQTLLERSFNRSETPKQLAEDDYFLYYTRKTCKPFFESQNPFIRLVKELMVTPLTNFTNLSLYFQLYLVEIFHVKFYTKLGHYLCMPLIVLLLATWCAQWRFIGSYRIEDVSVFIVNGTMVFLCVLQVWYLCWGFLFQMYLFGIFMAWPLFFMYLLANMLFQIIVINSYWLNESDLTVKEVWGKNSTHWYDFITLGHFRVVWYLHPLLWCFFFGFLQALSHICEAKLPPRVSQTAHWLDMTTILKENGYVHFSFIILSQTIFGTLNEFLASPRLLPLLVLRICYNLGYNEKEWVKFRMLVDECLKFGDPAIDYIGRGGARWPKEFKRWKPDSLKERVQTVERNLDKQQRENLKDPAFLLDETQFTKELQYYVMLRHRCTKYNIQVQAYGPFTPKVPENLGYNDVQMMNDFPNSPSFRIFLEEVRSHFAEMEFKFVRDCKLNRVLQ